MTLSSGSPRPGGYIKNLSAVDSKSNQSLARIVSREKRINRILEESEWGISRSVSRLDTSPPWDNMLAVTFSCVMLMASGTPNIPEEYYDWAERYLMCVRDERGNHPPNVQGILNHISLSRPKQKTSLKVNQCTCAPTSSCSVGKLEAEPCCPKKDGCSNTNKPANLTSTGS